MPPCTVFFPGNSSQCASLPLLFLRIYGNDTVLITYSTNTIFFENFNHLYDDDAPSAVLSIGSNADIVAFPFQYTTRASEIFMILNGVSIEGQWRLVR